MKTIDFLRELFHFTNKDILVRAIGGQGNKIHSEILNAQKLKLPENLDQERNWYFGVCPRTDGKALSCVAIFCDIDGVDKISKEVLRVAAPSLIVNSGHGYHLYWYLDREMPTTESYLLILLAQLSFDGADKRATDPTRLLRLPGTMNVKSKIHVPCEVVGGSHKRYTQERIEELLLAAFLIRYWVEGQRNDMTLGFAAITARCEWSHARTERVVRSVCQASGDREIQNRLKVVKLTHERYLNGEKTTFKEFSEIIGNRQGKLLELMGYAAAEGEVKYQGKIVGEVPTLIQDITRYFVEGDCEWAWDEGQLMQWVEGTGWVAREPSALASALFNVLEGLTTIKAGQEKKIPALPKNAEGIARMVKGTLTTRGFDPADPDLIGFQNGVLHITRGDFRPMRMQDHVKRIMPINFDPKAKAKTWERFLKEAVPDSVDFLQEWVGYCLTQGNVFERMVWVYGPQRTGKSTFLSTIFKMFGTKAATVSSQNISQYQLATLADAYLAVCTELSTQKFRTGIFKALVTGDPITARHPYGRPFDIQFSGKLMWASNILPVMDEVEGVWPRIVMVEFNVLPKEKDVMLRSKIMEEISGVINWALQGRERVVEYLKEGSWAIPEASVDAVSRYQSMSEIVDLFIRQEMAYSDGVGDCTTIREAYMCFNDFSKNMGHPSREFGAWFGEEFRRRGYTINERFEIEKAVMLRNNGSSVSWNVRTAK